MVLYEIDIQRLKEIQNYIESNLEKDLRIKIIAQHFRLTAHTLRRQFKVHTGVPVHHYILVQRMVRARELLLNRIMPVSEVANAVGYHEISTFSHAFSSYYGRSPNDCIKCGGEIEGN